MMNIDTRTHTHTTKYACHSHSHSVSHTTRCAPMKPNMRVRRVINEHYVYGIRLHYTSANTTLSREVFRVASKLSTNDRGSGSDPIGWRLWADDITTSTRDDRISGRSLRLGVRFPAFVHVKETVRRWVLQFGTSMAWNARCMWEDDGMSV